ncbi:MAG: hypothetical protein M5R36_18350 [Deltaproteobacteria bacterium]|nr:hypothetical protein [Deltaproteobacteria bacterium]
MADEAADFGGHGGPQLDAVAFLGVTDQNAYRTALGKAYAKDIAKKLAALGLQAHGKAYMVRLTLASDGSAKKVEILTDEVNDAKARKIIEDGFKKIKLPAPGKEAALVFYIRF